MISLEKLRAEIFSKTAPLKFPHSTVVSRTFYVPTSPTMNHLKEWFDEWFPILDGDLNKIYRWIALSEGEDISKTISKAVLEAKDVKTLSVLINKGYQVIENANQIIFIGDLTEDGFLESLKKSHKNFSDAFEGLFQEKGSLYRQGLFLISNLSRGYSKGAGDSKKTSIFGEFISWAKNNLDMVYFIDATNRFGTVVSDAKDLHFFLGHLAYVLTQKPVEFSKKDRVGAFREWVSRNSISQERFNGFSAISIVTPINQIIETLLVKKGGEILDQAFFGSFNEKRLNLYLNRILNKASLSSFEAFTHSLSKHPIYRFLDPFDAFNDSEKSPLAWDLNKPEGFTISADELDASLANYAETNGEIINKASETMLSEFEYSLLEDVNTAISTEEKGGMILVKDCLNKLKAHIKAMIPDEPASPIYPDSGPIIRNLEKRVKKGPRRAAVAIRSIVLSGSFLVGLITGLKLFDFKFNLLLSLSLLSLVFGYIYWHSWINRTENLVIKITGTIRKKWEAMMNYKKTSVVKDILPKYLQIVDEMISKVELAAKRLEKLSIYFKEEHLAPSPPSSAFWINTLDTRDEIVSKYYNLINVDTHNVALKYITEEKPLTLWNRLSSVESSEINIFEWGLVEKATLRIIDDCRDLVNISVCGNLRDFPEKAKNFLEFLKRSTAPFIRLKPEPDTTGSLEIFSNGCDDICSAIDHAIEGNYSTKLATIPAKTPYRISVFSFAESIDLNSLHKEA